MSAGIKHSAPFPKLRGLLVESMTSRIYDQPAVYNRWWLSIGLDSKKIKQPRSGRHRHAEKARQTNTEAQTRHLHSALSSEAKDSSRNLPCNTCATYTIFLRIVVIH